MSTSIDKQTTPIILREMTADDIDTVVRLDHIAFTTPWPARTYRYEINNDRSCMIVLELANIKQPGNGVHSGLGGLFKRLSGNGFQQRNMIVGYSGFWQISGEAHISTIAVHPDWRGRKLGELLLWTMIRQAVRLGANRVTLEVRVSNDVAKGLYSKYGFKIAGKRRQYYRDNKEDADVMQTGDLDSEYRKMLVRYGRDLGELLTIQDRMPTNISRSER